MPGRAVDAETAASRRLPLPKGLAEVLLTLPMLI